MKVLNAGLEFITDFSSAVTVIILVAAAVTWLAARAAVILVAQIIVYAAGFFGVIAITLIAGLFHQWALQRRAELRRDRTLADNEAAQSTLATDRTRIDIDRARMHLTAEARLMAATVRQVERGLIHPAALGEGKFNSFPVQVIKQVENGAVPLLEGGDTPNWPDKVSLLDLLPASNGNLDSIILGINLDESGRQTIIQTPLEDMVHCAYGGETGTGKSTLAYAVAYQIATAPQDAQLVLADPGGTTWKTLAGNSRLMYPLVQTENDCLYVLNELHGISVHRTDELFAPYPTVEKLSEYNNLVAPDDRLGYIVMFIDEFPEYLENREIETTLRRLIRKSRKAGIYIFGMGTSWKHSDMDTSIKRQFRTKVHFAASDRDSSKVLLGNTMAANLKNVGRAYARLPFNVGGADLVEIQTPYVDKTEVFNRLNGGSILDLPVSTPSPTLAEQAVIDARRNGAGYKECYRIYCKIETGELPGSVGGNQTQIVKDILTKWGVEDG